MSEARRIGDLLNGGQTIENIEDSVGLVVQLDDAVEKSNIIDIQDENSNNINGFDENGDLIRHTTFIDYGYAENDMGVAGGDVIVDLSQGQTVKFNVGGDITSFNIVSDPKHEAIQFSLLIFSIGEFNIDWVPFDDDSVSVGGWFGSDLTVTSINQYLFSFYLMDGVWYGKYRGALVT